MKRDYEQLSEEASLLNRYLVQYKNCINKKKNLETRLSEIRFEFYHPLSSVRMDGMPKGGGAGDGCAALVLRLEEIENRINSQIEKSMSVLTDIMNIIDFLPENSMERVIIEHKYIDLFSWNKICMRENISRTPAIRYWRKGLYMLLESDEVKRILAEYDLKIKSQTA